MRLILFALLLTMSAAAQTCTPHATQQAAAQTLTLQAKLLAAQSPQMETDVPAAIKPLLHDYKQALLRTVDTAVLCNKSDPAQIQSGLVALLHANIPARPFVPKPASKQNDEAPETGDYGGDLTIDVKAVASQNDLYSVQVTFDVECGNDSMLLLYRRESQGYRRVLAWFNPDLNSVGDALGDMFYFAPVPAPETAFVIVSGTPWCTSILSRFKADLVALATPSNPQYLLDHMTRDYRRDETTFKVRPEGFELRSLINSVDADLVQRPGILRYSTATGHFVQQPVAPNAQAFVDMWLGSEWAAVKDWSDPASKSHHQKLHEDMTSNGADLIRFGPTLACGGNHYQLELQMQADHTTANLQIIDLPSKYAQVQTNAASFTLLDITDKPDGSCKGPDLMQPRKH